MGVQRIAKILFFVSIIIIFNTQIYYTDEGYKLTEQDLEKIEDKLIEKIEGNELKELEERIKVEIDNRWQHDAGLLLSHTDRALNSMYYIFTGLGVVFAALGIVGGTVLWFTKDYRSLIKQIGKLKKTTEDSINEARSDMGQITKAKGDAEIALNEINEEKKRAMEYTKDTNSRMTGVEELVSQLDTYRLEIQNREQSLNALVNSFISILEKLVNSKKLASNSEVLKELKSFSENFGNGINKGNAKQEEDVVNEDEESIRILRKIAGDKV